MLVGLGLDTVAVARIKAVYARHGARFVGKILSASELLDFERLSAPVRAHFLARRFAAKEAALKALGSGLSLGMRWTDLSVEHDELGAPKLVLSGAAARRGAQLGVVNSHLSISDERDLAIAVVVLIGSASGSA